MPPCTSSIPRPPFLWIISLPMASSCQGCPLFFLVRSLIRSGHRSLHVQVHPPHSSCTTANRHMSHRHPLYALFTTREQKSPRRRGAARRFPFYPSIPTRSSVPPSSLIPPYFLRRMGFLVACDMYSLNTSVGPKMSLYTTAAKMAPTVIVCVWMSVDRRVRRSVYIYMNMYKHASVGRYVYIYIHAYTHVPKGPTMKTHKLS